MVTRQRPKGWHPPRLTDPLTHIGCQRHAGTDMHQDPTVGEVKPCLSGESLGENEHK